MRFERTFKAAGTEYADYDKMVPAPYLRGTFGLNGAPESVRIRITAAGFYDLYINGVRITKGILAPYIGNPDHFLVYDEYDLTPHVREGKNVLGIILGNGFNNAYGGFIWDFDKAPFRSAPKCAFCVEADGKKVFSSRCTLRTAPSPILRDEYHEGEVYDARREIADWSSPAFDDSGWQSAVQARTPRGECVLADFEPIAEYKRRRAVAFYPAADGYIYDFGVNTAGVPVLKVDGVRGQEIRLVCGEWLRGGVMDTQNIQCGVRMYANATFENTVRSDYSNFFYFPTDCPHREKNGWTGDAYLSSEQFMLLLDGQRSLRRWLACIRAAQKENGAVPCIVPTAGWGYGWGSGPSWDGVLTALPYMLYRYGAGREVLAENADAIERYLGFLEGLRGKNGVIAYGLGDWCQIGAKNEADYWTPNAVTDTCSAIDICDKAARIFGVLGQEERRARAQRLAASLREAARENFIDWNNGAAAYCRTQTAQALLIARGVFRKEESARAMHALLEMIEGAERHMRVGVLGIGALLRVLADGGHADLAYEMAMSPDRPSYADQILHGATSLWEFIHIHKPGSDEVALGRLKSMNHHFWGDIAAWYMTYLAGLRVNEAFDDPARIDIAPCFVRQLGFAQARHITPRGEASCAWQRRADGKIDLFVRLPQGTHGELKLCGGWQSTGDARLQPGGNQFVLSRSEGKA